MLGLAPRTIYNRLHTRGDLPPVIYLGRLPRFAITDIHEWLNAKRSSGSRVTNPVSGRRGRPTKAAQIAKRRMGGFA
ncbi:helix-turn-helix transcriptional regulator [Comamonas nitrativorans]|uniref:Helix-turn-helix transcriptional regulator n=1 Tax=Comamonas nitrativorans TaxID=108437 RepID=A0ABV9GVP3_9BURK